MGDNGLMVSETVLEIEQSSAKNQEKKSFIQSALHFASGTLLSRLCGVLREIAMATFFGTHPLLASWLVSFRSAHLLRRIVGEGGLSNGFIPYFQRLRLESEQKAALFFRDVFITMFCFLFLIVVAGELFLWKIAPCFLSENGLVIAQLAKYMLPALIFASLYALGMAFMQCQKRYFLSAAAPIFFNIAWIITIFAACRFPMEKVVIYLSVGTSIGLVAQWLVTFPSSMRYLYRELGGSLWQNIRLWSPDIKALLASMALTLIGVGAVQINSVVDLFFAKLSDPRGPAYLTYAARWMQLPLALCGVAVSSSIFPALSKSVAVGDLGKLAADFSHGLRHTLHLLLFATLFLFMVGASLMGLFLGHGQFSIESIWQTKACLAGYAAGLLPSGLVSLFAMIFYARKDFFTPVISSLASIVLSLLLNILCVSYWKMGPESIAYTTSIAAFINFGILFSRLNIDLKELPGVKKALFKACGIICSLVGGAALASFAFPSYAAFFFEMPSALFAHGAIVFHLCRLASFVLLYVALIYLWKIVEWEEILSVMLKRGFSKSKGSAT